MAAKHAQEGLSKVAALEGAPYGVTGNCISPGYVRTPLTENRITAQATAHGIHPDDVLRDIMLHHSAVKRLIEPDEIAAAALFLCRPHARHITGTSRTPDGGWTASRPCSDRSGTSHNKRSNCNSPYACTSSPNALRRNRGPEHDYVPSAIGAPVSPSRGLGWTARRREPSRNSGCEPVVSEPAARTADHVVVARRHA